VDINYIIYDVVTQCRYFAALVLFSIASYEALFINISCLFLLYCWRVPLIYELNT